jgi:hypothetical protein
MALKTTITSNTTDNEISVYENTERSLTILIQNLYYEQQFSVFCFEDIEDAEEFLKVFKKELSLYKKSM